MAQAQSISVAAFVYYMATPMYEVNLSSFKYVGVIVQAKQGFVCKENPHPTQVLSFFSPHWHLTCLKFD